ncbi:unnamed protein product [Gongylonema pulchrum]|uniref:DUF2052 domain-containing protein n=1 Tax=Gongylonema pulchrum TaxID=637853 RepID=A0A183DK43_9BILA|nr:unnamed protein product [Gongylonema pulchrum]
MLYFFQYKTWDSHLAEIYDLDFANKLQLELSKKVKPSATTTGGYGAAAANIEDSEEWNLSEDIVSTETEWRTQREASKSSDEQHSQSSYTNYETSWPSLEMPSSDAEESLELQRSQSQPEASLLQRHIDEFLMKRSKSFPYVPEEYKEESAGRSSPVDTLWEHHQNFPDSYGRAEKPNASASKEDPTEFE